MPAPFQPMSLGFILAILVLVLAVVFAAIGQLDYRLAGLIGALAVARMT